MYVLKRSLRDTHRYTHTYLCINYFPCTCITHIYVSSVHPYLCIKCTHVHTYVSSVHSHIPMYQVYTHTYTCIKCTLIHTHVSSVHSYIPMYQLYTHTHISSVHLSACIKCTLTHTHALVRYPTHTDVRLYISNC